MQSLMICFPLPESGRTPSCMTKPCSRFAIIGASLYCITITSIPRCNLFIGSDGCSYALAVGGPRIAVGEDNNKLLLCRAVAAVDAGDAGGGCNWTWCHDNTERGSRYQLVRAEGGPAAGCQLPRWRLGWLGGTICCGPGHCSSGGINHSIFHGDPITDNWAWI